MPNKVKSNASNITKQLEQNTTSERNDTTLRSKEYIPINKKIFSHFLDKFEDDHSRQVTKAQLQQLTLEQKQYLSQQAPSWLKRQEEKQRKELEKQEKLIRDEEERRRLEEENRRLEYERQKRLEEEVEEKRKQMEIKELQERIEKEKNELKASKKAANKAKKEAKRKSKLDVSPPTTKELPKIVSTTCNDLKKKFDVKKNIQSSQMLEFEEVQKKEGPVVRKLINNPFERNPDKNVDSEVVKRREFPVSKQNRIGDLKKRYTMFMTSGNTAVNDSKETNNEGKNEVALESLTAVFPLVMNIVYLFLRSPILFCFETGNSLRFTTSESTFLSGFRSNGLLISFLTTGPSFFCTSSNSSI
jgi:hypothetical protein